MQPRSWDGLGVLVFIVIGNKSLKFTLMDVYGQLEECLATGI